MERYFVLRLISSLLTLPIIIATSHCWPLYILYTLCARGRRWVHRVATRKYLPSRFVLGGRTLFLWNFKRTIGVRAEEFLTLRELPWQQWQAVINPRRERRRMVKRGEEEEETRTDRRTDGPTDSPSLSSAASDPLIFCPYLFSLVTSSPVADPFALRRKKMREFVSFLLRRFAMRKRRGFPGN